MGKLVMIGVAVAGLAVVMSGCDKSCGSCGSGGKTEMGAGKSMDKVPQEQPAPAKKAESNMPKDHPAH